jgi:hypothetical protein
MATAHRHERARNHDAGPPDFSTLFDFPAFLTSLLLLFEPLFGIVWCADDETLQVEGDGMPESFLSQLEQRTEQVKITLANLEAQRVRIEQQIAQLQPVIPHYDALLTAERALREANVEIDEAREAPAVEAAAPYVPSWQAQNRVSH